MKTHVWMDVREMGVLSKSKFLQLQIFKCESSIYNVDADSADDFVYDADADVADDDIHK